MRLFRVGLFKFITLSILLILSLCIEGCRRYDNAFIPWVDRSFKLPKRVEGTSDTRVIKKIRALNRERVIKVMTIGSDYLISIPSPALFPDQSPQITWNGYAVLNKVVRLMKEFRKVAVNVTAYSSQYVSIKREQALTLARAKGVANYLWSQGIDSRFIFAEGAGSEKPVSSYRQGNDASPISRIEIIFREAII